MTTVAPPAPAQREQRAARQAPPEHESRYVLNVRLLVITLIVVPILGVAAYFWHSFMLGHTSVAYLQRAEELEQEEEYRKSAGYLFRYLQIQPDDVEVRVRLAKVFDKSAEDDPRKKNRAIELYQRASALQPENMELRERLAELQLEVARYVPKRLPMAIDEANALLRRDDRNRVGLRVLALAQWQRTKANMTGSLRKSEVITLFQRGLKYHPGDIDLATFFAQIYRKELDEPSQAERNEIADSIMRKMVEESPDDPEAHLTHYRYSKIYDLPDAQQHIDKAVELGPEDIDVLLTAGQHEMTEGVLANQEEEWEKAAQAFRRAEDYYRRVIDLEPSNERGHLGLGQTFRAQGKSGLAIETWEEGLEHAGRDNIELNARIVHTLIQLNRLDRVDEILSELQHSIDKASARWPAAVRKAARNTVNFLRAKWHAKSGHHREAVALLREVLVVFQSGVYKVSAERLRNDYYEAAMLLGQAQASLNRWDLAAAAFVDAAGTVEQHSPEKTREAKIKAGEAYRNGGRDDLAAKYLGQVIEGGQAPLGVWLVRVESLIRRQLRLPENERNWDDVQQQLVNPPLRLRNSWQVKLLEADYVLARKGDEGVDAALSFLSRAEEQHPGDANLYQRLAAIYERLGKRAEADRALARLGKLDGEDSLRYALVQAEILALRGKHDEAEKILLSGLDRFPENQHGMLHYGLSQLYLQQGELASAKEQVRAMHEADPENAQIVYRLAELTVDQKEFDQLDPWIEKLRELEGTESVRWKYFRALHHLSRSKNPDDADFAAARGLLEEIIGDRSSWPPGHVLKAQLLRREGKINEAIRAYESAIELGETRIGVYEQYIVLLYRAKRFDKVTELIDRQQELTQTLYFINQEMKQRQGDNQAALELAKKAVEVQPKDPYLRIHLGQIFLRLDKRQEAEAQYLQAVELAPLELGVRGALVAFYVRIEDDAKAHQAVEAVAADEQFDAAQRELFQLQAYEAMGESELALEHYQQALEAAGEDVDILLQLARYRVKRHPEEAKKILRKAHQIAPENVRVRGRLAELLVQSGKKEDLAEAESLLQAEGAGEDATPENMRLLGRLLASRGDDANRKKAVAIFQELVRNPFHNEQDRLQLARLLEGDGRLAEAKKQYAALIGVPSPKPAHLVSYIDMLLRHDQVGASEPWVRKLTEVAEESLQTLAVQVRWMKATGRSDQEIEERIEAFAQFKLLKAAGKSEKQRLYGTLGRIYENVGSNSGAMRWYRELYKVNPEVYGPLAVTLAKAKRLQQAYDLWKYSAGTSEEVKDASILANIFAAAQAQDDLFRQAAEHLEKAVQQHPENIGLLFGTALAYTTQNQAEKAVTLYRRILKSQPRHVPTLNNLAYALIELPDKKSESLQYIDQAIRISGRQPALLDTKAMIVMEDSPEQAVELLEEATQTPSADPRYYFHLAVAYEQSGVISKARDAMERAEAGKLADMPLTSSERYWLHTLNAALD